MSRQKDRMKAYVLLEKNEQHTIIGPGSFFIPETLLHCVKQLEEKGIAKPGVTQEAICIALNIAFQEGFKQAQKDMRNAIGTF